MYYISKKRQEEMQEKINRFYEIIDSGIEKNHETDKIMSELYKDFDKLIIGIIRTPMYKFYQYGIEDDELIAEARFQIYLSIMKKQWDPTRGASLFSFYSTVVARNLRNFTKTFNKKKNRNISTPIEEILNEELLFWNADFQEDFVNNYIFDEIENYFKHNEKEKFLKLAQTFRNYFLCVLRIFFQII